MNTLTFSQAHRAVPVSSKFLELLQQQLNQTQDATGFITIHFRDSTYSSELGGFHPVEVGLREMSKGTVDILYITEFAFSGGPFPELERCIDFDIGNQMAYTQMCGWQDIQHREVKELYQFWETNFLSYVEDGCLDEIQVRVN